MTWGDRILTVGVFATFLLTLRGVYFVFWTCERRQDEYRARLNERNEARRVYDHEQEDAA